MIGPTSCRSRSAPHRSCRTVSTRPFARDPAVGRIRAGGAATLSPSLFFLHLALSRILPHSTFTSTQVSPVVQEASAWHQALFTATDDLVFSAAAMASSTSQSTTESITNTIADAANCEPLFLQTISAARSARSPVLILPLEPAPARTPRLPSAFYIAQRTDVYFATDVSETVQEYTSGTSKEANSESPRVPISASSNVPLRRSPFRRAEEVAKGNTDASIGDRVSAGFSAMGDKADEEKQCVPASALLYASENHADVFLSPTAAPRPRLTSRACSTKLSVSRGV